MNKAKIITLDSDAQRRTIRALVEKNLMSASITNLKSRIRLREISTSLLRDEVVASGGVTVVFPSLSHQTEAGVIVASEMLKTAGRIAEKDYPNEFAKQNQIKQYSELDRIYELLNPTGASLGAGMLASDPKTQAVAC